MQLQVNITPSVTLLLVRRVTCRALIGRKHSTSYPAGHLKTCCVLVLTFVYLMFGKLNSLHY